MRFLARADIRERFRGRSVAIVGTGPGSLENPPGFVDAHDLVVRVNNYKLINGPDGGTGTRTDVFYSFFGPQVTKRATDLVRDGVTLCMSSLPDARPVRSDWHRRHRKLIWIDFRHIYLRRANWWFCDVCVPTVAEYRQVFDLLERHQPTTGFTAIQDILSFEPASVTLTGFDFFRSEIHNVDEPWMRDREDDPFNHRPDLERDWLAANWNRYQLAGDPALMAALGEKTAAASEP